MIFAILGFVILVHIIILSKLVFLPYPELFVYPYLTNAGLLPYAQILDQHFPGLMFLPINLDNLGFHTPTDARIWQYGLIVLTHILLFLSAKKLFKSDLKALAANFLYLTWQPYFEGWMLWINNFLPVFYLSAFYFFIRGEEEKKNNFYLYSGLFLGVATLFKQVAIPLFLFLFVYLVIRRKFMLLKYLTIGYLPIPLLMVFYFVVRGIFSDFWYWSVGYNITTFAREGRKYANLIELIRAGFVIGIPLFLVFITRFKHKFLLGVFALGALAVVYARFDFIHLQPALPFAVLCLVSAIGLLTNRKLKVILAFAYISVTFIFLRQFYDGVKGDKVYFFDDQTLLVSEKIQSLTQPGEKIFIFGATYNLYQMSKTLPAGDVFVFQFPWFTSVVEGRVLEGIKKDKPRLVVMDPDATISGSRITDFMNETYLHIVDNYQEIEREGSTRLLRRKDENF